MYDDEEDADRWNERYDNTLFPTGGDRAALRGCVLAVALLAVLFASLYGATWLVRRWHERPALEQQP